MMGPVFFTSLLTTRFSTAVLLATHVLADWLLDWSKAAKWSCILTTYLVAAYSTHQRSKHNGCASWSNCE